MAKKPKEEPEEKNTQNLDNESIIDAICGAIPEAEILNAETVEDLGFINTGNLAINYICSGKFIDGGIPVGRITEIYGPSSTGKTVIGTHILQGVQKAGGIAVLIDSESAYSASFGEVLGLDTKHLVYMQPECLEDCFKNIVKIVKAVRSRTTDMRPVAIVYDSIAASPARLEVEKLSKDEDIGSGMGIRARLCSDYLRNIASYLNKQKVAVIIVNQIRSKIGVMMGNPETTAGGGNSLIFYCSLRLDCRARGKILDAKKQILGIEMSVKNTKNKIFKPFKVADGIELYFDKGISPISGLLKLLVEDGKIEQGGAWYSVPGRDTKFQGKNILNVLLEIPELIGASTKEEVEDFLGVNQVPLEASLEEAVSVEEVSGAEGE
jgi:recombination protein RecA